MKRSRPTTGDIRGIFVFFYIIGIITGLATGVVEGLRYYYIQKGMLEVFFWSLTKNFFHHLEIFLVIAALNISLLYILYTSGVSKRRTAILALIPFTVALLLYFYIIPYRDLLSGNWIMLIKRVGILQSLGAILVLLLLFGAAYAWLKRSGARKTGGGRHRITSHPAFLVALLLVPAIVWIMDLRDWSGAAEGRWNLILISVDTLRADHLGCYGYPEDTSPHLDEFASESVQFTKAVSQCSWTLPSHASIFTGMYPSLHGAVSKRRVIARDDLLLGEILRNAGYSTMAFTGGGYLDPVYGFSRGFNAYLPFESMDSDRVWHALDDELSEPFFLFLHTYQVHDYYVPEDTEAEYQKKAGLNYGGIEEIRPFLVKYMRRDLTPGAQDTLTYLEGRYDRAIGYLDGQFGSFIDGLNDRGLLDRTIVIVLSDHGEEFGEHHRTHHGGTLFNDQLHVPLLMRLPLNGMGGKKVGEVVELIDVLPTICDLLGVPSPPGINGHSLVPLLRGERGDINGLAFSELTKNKMDHYSVCDSTTKLIYICKKNEPPFSDGGTPDVYLLNWGQGRAERPLEEGGEELLDPFHRWCGAMAKYRAGHSMRGEISLKPRLEEELKALGYIQ